MLNMVLVHTGGCSRGCICGSYGQYGTRGVCATLRRLRRMTLSWGWSRLQDLRRGCNPNRRAGQRLGSCKQNWPQSPRSWSENCRCIMHHCTIRLVCLQCIVEIDVISSLTIAMLAFCCVITRYYAKKLCMYRILMFLETGRMPCDLRRR